MILRRTVHASPSALAIALALCTAVATSSNVAQAQTPPPAAPKPAPTPAAPATAPTAPATAPTAPAAAPAPTPAPTTTAAPTPAPSPAPVEPAPVAPAPVGPAPTAPATAAPSTVPLWPEPGNDAAALQAQGNTRPKQASPGSAVNEEDRIYAEDWWSHARPILELHGYFRVRAQLFHKFGLGRLDPPNQAMWPRPADDYYEATGTNNDARTPTGPSEACTESESGTGPSNATSSATEPCHANMQAGANLRFRLNPELHISDNLRVMSQVDLLDNLVLGSTPGGYDNSPAPNGGYAVNPRDGYAPLGFYDDTQSSPSAGKNSFKDSIRVKRAWAEYAMPIGEIRFGRMPFHWGLGMMFNAGDGHDDDYQSTVDRIQVISGIKPLDLYFSAAWDFPNEGVTSDAAALPNAEPYDLAQLDDVNQYVFSIARRKSPQLERLALTRGELVLNAGFQLLYRQQTLSNDRTTGASGGTIGSAVSGECSQDAQALGCPVGYAETTQFVRRDAHAFIPDLWLQLKYKKFRFETEIATIQGSIANVDPFENKVLQGAPEYDIRAWGFAAELEQKLVEDKLSLGFKFGWASGDADVDGLAPGTGGSLAQLGDTTLETFRFHPNYRVDMILARHILTRQQGTYYFRPSADYDFLRDSQGQRVGGGLAAIWTRASEFMQAPGHDRDLGIELNGRIYYQSKDGALNDVPGILGGFYTQIDYGVLFPMAGLGYPDGQAADIVSSRQASDAADTRIAQTLRWYLGVLF